MNHQPAQKRHRGGQPGNRNAFKHGLYSRHLPPAAQQNLQLASRIDPADLTNEIALARARLAELIRTTGIQAAEIDLAIRTLVRVATAAYRLSPRASRDLADHLAAVLNDLANQILPPE